MPLDDTLEMQVKGRHVMEGVLKTITVIDEDVRSALADSLN